MGAEQCFSVFVTGNANKLREVKEILSQGHDPIDIESQNLDSAAILGSSLYVFTDLY